MGQYAHHRVRAGDREVLAEHDRGQHEGCERDPREQREVSARAEISEKPAPIVHIEASQGEPEEGDRYGDVAIA